MLLFFIFYDIKVQVHCQTPSGGVHRKVKAMVMTWATADLTPEQRQQTTASRDKWVKAHKVANRVSDIMFYGFLFTLMMLFLTNDKSWSNVSFYVACLVLVTWLVTWRIGRKRDRIWQEKSAAAFYTVSKYAGLRLGVDQSLQGFPQYTLTDRLFPGLPLGLRIYSETPEVVFDVEYDPSIFPEGSRVDIVYRKRKVKGRQEYELLEVAGATKPTPALAE